MKKLITSVAAAALISTSAMAAGNTNTGCGLGSMIIKNQDTMIMQLAATFLNGLSANQTFGITSGSLGCTKPASIAMNDQAQKFVADNMDSIAVEVAAGQGENLDTLLTLINVEDKALAAATLKANFSKIYSSSDITSAEVIDNIVTVL